MGTYTTNKKLFMPTVGETGWGELVNNNFETIDTFLKPITVSGSTYTFTGNHVGNQSGGSISATTGTFSGAVTGTTGTFSGAVAGTKFTRTSNYNVTTSTAGTNEYNSLYPLDGTYVCILPSRSKPYNGTVTLRKQNALSAPVINYITSLDATTTTQISFGADASEIKTITLSNAKCLYIKTEGRVGVGNITLT